ncbi:hypothetical protein [Brevibacillus porteri]|uniref:hypothetical protein n=1 Tax=Brevibacillus porteri TaxID=2126350 RepID=UPI003D1F5257
MNPSGSVWSKEKASWHRFASGGKRDKKLVECLFRAAKTAFFALPASLDWI